MTTLPTVGQAAPETSGFGTEGQIASLQELRGRWVVLYFYPRDNTPGCTRQACAFRDSHPDFQRLNTLVLGVSPDKIESHEKFTAKFELPFPLLSDPDREIAKAYGVWQEKKLYGKTSLGIVRSTFLLDPEGKIRAVWSPVRVDGHAEQVMEKLKELQAQPEG